MQPAAGATRQPREYVPDRADSDVDDPDLGAAAMEATPKAEEVERKAASGPRRPSSTGLTMTPKGRSPRATSLRSVPPPAKAV